MPVQVSTASMNVNGNLWAIVHDNNDPFSPENIVEHWNGTSFNHPAVDFKFTLTSTPPPLAGLLTGPYEFTVYWEGMGSAAPEGQTSTTVTGTGSATDMVAEGRIILPIHTEGLYRISLVVKINQGAFKEIAGFADLGMIQVVNTA